MANWLVVLLKIAAMFLVIVAGLVGRRRALLTAETTSALSRFVVEITFPALIFTQMLRTVDGPSLSESWPIVLLGGFILIIGQLVGMGTVSLFTRREQRPTYVFLVAAANWVYLPLPIALAVYGDPGVRAVLLANVGAQFVLWTLGMWTLRGGKPDAESVRNLVANPGLIATAVGIVLALTVPVLNTLEIADPVTLTGAWLPAKVLIDALAMVGGLTIPLSLIVTGAQLGGLDLSDHRPSRTLTGVIVARLLLSPVALVAVVMLASLLGGYAIPEVPRRIGYLIACMPVAVSCSIFTERFGGDTALTSRAIFYSTLLSILTVPVLFYLVQALGL